MLKYRHRNCQKSFIPATFAYDLPPSNFFKELFCNAEEYISFPFGMTLVHPSDNYCKATGRHYALSYTKTTTFKLMFIVNKNKRQTYTLESTIGLHKVVMQVSTSLSDNYNTRLDWIELA